MSSFDVTVEPGGSATRAESVPVVWTGAPPWLRTADKGDEIVVVGRVRRRFFRAGTAVQSRTEVVVEAAAPARQRARTASITRRAAEALAGAATPGSAPPAAVGSATVTAGGRGAAARRAAPPTFP